MKLFSPNQDFSPMDTFTGGEFFAVLRLIVRAGYGKELETDNRSPFPLQGMWCCTSAMHVNFFSLIFLCLSLPPHTRVSRYGNGTISQDRCNCPRLVLAALP
jgi:hypothetical protein